MTSSSSASASTSASTTMRFWVSLIFATSLVVGWLLHPAGKLGFFFLAATLPAFFVLGYVVGEARVRHKIFLKDMAVVLTDDVQWEQDFGVAKSPPPFFPK